MTNKQALRQTAEKAQEHGVFNMDIHSETVLAMLDEISELEKQHCGTALLEREQAHTETVSRLMDELEAKDKRIAELTEGLDIATQAMSDVESEMIGKLSAIDDALCELLPGVQYMDPPDGGSVTPLEQVRRMIADYRERIAELEAREVKLPDVEKWRSPEAVRAQSAYRALARKELSAAGIITKVGE